MSNLGDIITFDFTTHNPSTGMVSDADALPTCEVFEDDNDTEILSPVVSKRTGKTGNYRVSIETSTANGFEVGKSYNVIVATTVNLVSAKARVAVFVLDSKRNADLNDLSTSQVRSEVDLEFTERGYSADRAVLLDNLDVEISTRALETSGKIDNIKVKTDQLTFTVPNKVDATFDTTAEVELSQEDHDLIVLIPDIKDKTDQMVFTLYGGISATVDDFTETALDQIREELDPIKIKTDQLTFTVSNKVDATFDATAEVVLSQEEHDQLMLIDDIKTKTDEMTFVPGGGISVTVDDFTETALDHIRGELDPIKIKTDQLTFTVPNKVDVTTDSTAELQLSQEEHDNIMLIPDIKSKTDQLTFTVLNKVDATAEAVLSPEVEEAITTIGTDLKRALGLLHENIYIDLPDYDENNNLVSARVRIYSSPVSVGTDSDIIGTYQIISETSGLGKFTSWKQVSV